jgi:uncharacterized membrane protein
MMEKLVCVVGLVVFVGFLLVACGVVTLIGMDIEEKAKKRIESEYWHDREVG